MSFRKLLSNINLVKIFLNKVHVLFFMKIKSIAIYGFYAAFGITMIATLAGAKIHVGTVLEPLPDSRMHSVYEAHIKEGRMPSSMWPYVVSAPLRIVKECIDEQAKRFNELNKGNHFDNIQPLYRDNQTGQFIDGIIVGAQGKSSVIPESGDIRRGYMNEYYGTIFIKPDQNIRAIAESCKNFTLDEAILR